MGVVPKDCTVKWNRYRILVEEVAQEDGGGYRIYYPTLGYAVYGVGDTLDETMNSLRDSKRLFEEMVRSNLAQFPEPSLEDLMEDASRARSASGCGKFAYAA